jgi:hypothetical protein
VAHEASGAAVWVAFHGRPQNLDGTTVLQGETYGNGGITDHRVDVAPGLSRSINENLTNINGLIAVKTDCDVVRKFRSTMGSMLHLKRNCWPPIGHMPAAWGEWWV